MKPGLVEIAQVVYQGLKERGIPVTLSGGACVSIYSTNAYESYDLDFIRAAGIPFSAIVAAMEEMGFRREGRHFVHPDSDYFVEFPPPPLSFGEEPAKPARERLLKSSRGRIAVKMIDPTDCVKDRLCGFFHWNDLQCLDQAVLVARRKKVRLGEIERWSQREGMRGKFGEFRKILKEKSASRRKRRP